jgi:hypothetical protein
MRQCIDPNFVRPNRVEGHLVVMSRVYALRNLGDGLHIALRQTRSIWANDAGVSAASSEEKCATKYELAHRPNETKMSDGGRERALLGVEVRKSSKVWTRDGPAFAPSHG